MLDLALLMVRRRLSSLVAVACAVLGGAALVTGTGILAESGLRSHVAVGRLAAAAVVVSAPQSVDGPDLPLALPERGTLPADVVPRLQRVPGVISATGDIGFPAAVLGRDGEVVPSDDARVAGHAWSSIELLDDPRVEGDAPVGNQVAISRTAARAADVTPGGQIDVVAAGRTRTYRLAAVVDSPDAGVLFPDEVAEHLAGRDAGPRVDSVDVIGVRVDPEHEEETVSAIERELEGSGLVVSTGADRGDVELPGSAASRSLLVVLAASLAGVISLVIGFIVAGALSTSIRGQRRELALLRAVGATPRQVRRLVATEATVIAGIAAVPGVALGHLLADRFRDLLVRLDVIPANLPLTLSPLPALAAILLMLAVVQVSARTVAWRTSRMPATEAVAESRSEPRAPSVVRHRAGQLLIVAALTLSVAPLLSRSVVGAAATSMAGILAAIGLALSGPVLVSRLSRTVARRLPKGAPAPAWLAVSNTRAYPLRVAGAVTTLAMAVVFTLTYAYAQTTVMSAQQRDVTAGIRSDTTISAPALGGVPEDVVEQVRSTPGIRAAAPVGSTTVLWSNRTLGAEEVESVGVQVLDPAAPGIRDLDVTDGSLADLSGRTVALGQDAARSRRVHIGASLRLTLGDGAEVTAKVVAIYRRSLGFGPLVISRDLASGHVIGGVAQSIAVRTDGSPGTRAALDELVRSRPGLVLTDGGSDAAQPVPAEVWINLATITVLLGYLLLGIANKLVAMTAQRRHEVATLRLNGMTPRQVMSMMRHEGVLVAAAAVVGGLAVSTVPLSLLGVGFLGRPLPGGPWWIAPATLLVVTGIAYASIVIPARRVLRLAPAEVLGER